MTSEAIKRFLWILWTGVYFIMVIIGIILFIPFWIITGKNYWACLEKKMRLSYFEGIQPFE
jgi:hypothetical protein